jgi:hypothetical protein
MTIGAFGRLTRLNLIVRALMGERFVRGALLHELIDLAAEAPGFEGVLAEAVLLLRAVEQGLDGVRFDRLVESMGVKLTILEEAQLALARPPTDPAVYAPSRPADPALHV